MILGSPMIPLHPRTHFAYVGVLLPYELFSDFFVKGRYHFPNVSVVFRNRTVR